MPQADAPQDVPRQTQSRASQQAVSTRRREVLRRSTSEA
jgi:hypothetical protein